MKSFVIRTTFEGEPGSDWIHEFRNFGEDVWRELRHDAEISLDEIDSSTTSFGIRRITRRRVSHVEQRLRKLIASHGFEGDLVLEHQS